MIGTAAGVVVGIALVLAVAAVIVLAGLGLAALLL